MAKRLPTGASGATSNTGAPEASDTSDATDAGGLPPSAPSTVSGHTTTRVSAERGNESLNEPINEPLNEPLGLTSESVPVVSSTPSGNVLSHQSSDIDWHDEAAAIAASHWRRTLWLVAVLMVIGFVVTFVPQFWAREWSSIRFAGWSLPFYMGAQGSILIDIVLIVIYALMQRLNDARYRNALRALRDARRDSLGLDDDLESAMAPATSRSASSRAASAHIYR